uniref:GPI transamidase component PIG-S n=1 Tax=Ciona savignyi TaxID=51511 RepID=H2YV43_CIOSA
NSEKTQRLTAIATGAIFLLVGIPIWWKTTEVYRAELPFDEISQLNQDPSLKNRVILAQAPLKEEDFDEFSKVLTETIKHTIMIQPSSEFELLFSLVCPDAGKMNWDVENAISEFINPILEELLPIFKFQVSSQVLYLTKLPVRPKIQKNATSNEVVYYYLQDNQLSHVINGIESRLGSHQSTFPTLNFVLYMADKKHSPLYIKKPNGEISKSNNFLVPRWGGMTIYNPGNKLDLNLVMPTFLSNLRTLVGVQNTAPKLDTRVLFEDVGYPGITDWEVDYLSRLRAVENIATATHTLGSLEKLLNQIRNMVINDDVASSVYQSVKSIIAAKEAISNGDLSKSLSESRDAFVASETAFFHPSLLELLYFPEDQKFAIYIPLFLPMSLPIVASLIALWKRYRNREKPK